MKKLQLKALFLIPYLLLGISSCDFEFSEDRDEFFDYQVNVISPNKEEMKRHQISSSVGLENLREIVEAYLSNNQESVSISDITCSKYFNTNLKGIEVEESSSYVSTNLTKSENYYSKRQLVSYYDNSSTKGFTLDKWYETSSTFTNKSHTCSIIEIKNQSICFTNKNYIDDFIEEANPSHYANLTNARDVLLYCLFEAAISKCYAEFFSGTSSYSSNMEMIFSSSIDGELEILIEDNWEENLTDSFHSSSNISYFKLIDGIVKNIYIHSLDTFTPTNSGETQKEITEYSYSYISEETSMEFPNIQ